MKNINSQFTKLITDLIKTRYSCRTYTGEPIKSKVQDQLINFFQNLPPGPFNSQPRFELIASTVSDSDELSGLGTYGFIKDAPAYIIGAAGFDGNHLEDFGYLMEAIILYATDLELGTCWLGGTFTRSSFADRVNLAGVETIPAVTAVGYPAPNPRKFDSQIRQTAGSDHRFSWQEIFFNEDVMKPLAQDQVGDFRVPLEMVRLGPSASNKQPWRITKEGDCFHFFLLRTPGYRNKFYNKLIKIEDLQRVDMGIALCHFELTANAFSLQGNWQFREKTSSESFPGSQYLISWVW